MLVLFVNHLYTIRTKLNPGVVSTGPGSDLKLLKIYLR